jgi:hypothetical protein
MPIPRFPDLVLVVAVLLTASPAGAVVIAAPQSPGATSPEIHGPASSGGCAASPISRGAATPPLGLSGCSGVRPGAAVRTDAGLCTLGFLFRGTDGERYVATSAQCMEPFIGERAPARGRGAVASDEFGRRIGEFAYGVTDIRADFALIRLDRDVPASTQMCHFGGPTGQNDDGGLGPVVLHYYGTGFLTSGTSVVPEGVGLGRIAPGRSAFGVGLDDPDWVFAYGTAIYGDLGSAVISSDGRAVGLLVFAGVVRSETHSGTLGIIRLGPQVARAEKRLGIGLELLTAPVTSDGVPVTAR